MDIQLRNAVNQYRLRGLTPNNIADKRREELVKFMQNSVVTDACNEFYGCLLAKINERHGCNLEGLAIVPFAHVIKEAPFIPADGELHERTLLAAEALCGKVQEIFECLEMGLKQNKEVSFDLVDASVTVDFEKLFKDFDELHISWHEGFSDAMLKATGAALCSQYVMRDAVDEEMLQAARICNMEDVMHQSAGLVNTRIDQLQQLIAIRIGPESLAKIQMDYDLDKDKYKVYLI